MKRLSTQLCTLLMTLLTGTAFALDLPELMKDLSAQKEGRARFVEQKTLSVLSTPIESRGELSFKSPDFLQKKTTQPIQETLTVERDRLILNRGGKEQIIQLEAQPEMRAFIDSLRATLSGDLPTLKKSFLVKLSGPANKWTLSLRPLSANLQRILVEVSIQGRNSEILFIETTMLNGDRTFLSLLN